MDNNEFKIAHLILAHTDPLHISRLVSVLSKFSDVFLYVDKKSEMDLFSSLITETNCYFVMNRLPIYWGGGMLFMQK